MLKQEAKVYLDQHSYEGFVCIQFPYAVVQLCVDEPVRHPQAVLVGVGFSKCNPIDKWNPSLARVKACGRAYQRLVKLLMEYHNESKNVCCTDTTPQPTGISDPTYTGGKRDIGTLMRLAMESSKEDLGISPDGCCDVPESDLFD
jgi:hypothetical protein